jgi:hypothetical protein
VILRGSGWVLASSCSGVGAFAALYETGERAGVILRSLQDGTREYTVGKASEFVHGFPVPEILQALRVSEAAKNPAQSREHDWGGGSTIGGSPRNPDGSGSVLTPHEVFQVIERVLGADC